MSATGPPELFDLEEIEAELERESAWDDYYDLAAKEAAEADWAALKAPVEISGRGGPGAIERSRWAGSP